MNDFFTQRTRQALELSNRGPLEISSNGGIDERILEAYWEQGFYVLENVIDTQEIEELREEFEKLLERAPSSSTSTTDKNARVLAFDDVERKLFHFVKPLSDPYGGTQATNSRYQVKISEPPIPADAPDEVLLQIGGILQFLDPCLRIYGHPDLLRLAEAVNGADFTPFNEVIWLKQPKFGAAVAWHQDGTTHWESPELDEGTHGFNFMLNLFETSAENSLWVLPKTHRFGKANIKELVANSSSEYLDGAVPLLCRPGDVAIVNRQIVHGSFPNQSDQPRYTFVFGFHRRASVEGVQGWAREPYTDDYLRTSSRIIPLAVAARQVHYPEEDPYQHQLFTDAHPIEWDELHRLEILKHYHKRAIGI